MTTINSGGSIFWVGTPGVTTATSTGSTATVAPSSGSFTTVIESGYHPPEQHLGVEPQGGLHWVPVAQVGDLVAVVSMTAAACMCAVCAGLGRWQWHRPLT